MIEVSYWFGDGENWILDEAFPTVKTAKTASTTALPPVGYRRPARIELHQDGRLIEVGAVQKSGGRRASADLVWN